MKSKLAQVPGGTMRRVAVPDREATMYDINRCRKCGDVVTKRQLQHCFSTGELPLCPCGSNSISPGNVRWFDWFKPRVLRQAWDALRYGASVGTE